MSKKPFLMHFSQRQLDLKSLGHDMDFRTRVSTIIGHEQFSNERCILILSRIHDVEADLIGVELAKRGVNYLRVNADYFPDKARISVQQEEGISSLVLNINGVKLDAKDISLVWHRHFDLEAFQSTNTDKTAKAFAVAEWRAFIDILKTVLTCRWINEPEAAARLDKLTQLKLAAELGFRTPKTLISNDPEEIKFFYEQCNGNIICKSLRHHYIEDEPSVLHEVFAHRLEAADLEKLEHTSYAPSVFQMFFADTIEVRVTVIGTTVFSAELTNKQDADDWHRMGTKEVRLSRHELPTAVSDACVTFLHHSGLDFGAFDLLLLPCGEYAFLEVNVTGDWHWVQVGADLAVAEAVLGYMLREHNGEGQQVHATTA